MQSIGSDALPVKEKKNLDSAWEGITLCFLCRIKSFRNTKAIDNKNSCWRLNKSAQHKVFEEGRNQTWDSEKSKSEKNIIEKMAQ